MNRMNIVKRCAAGLLAASAVLLSGCSLALDAEDTGDTDGRLIGVYITRDYVDLFDVDSYLNDNLKDLTSGGNLEVGGEEYSGRLYAEKRGVDDGESPEYDFGIDGIMFACGNFTDENGDSRIRVINDGNSLADTQSNIKSTDEGTQVELKGCIYVAPTDGQDVIQFYVNPVYMDSRENIYLTTGTGLGSNMTQMGEEMAHSISEQHTVTENGETKTDSIDIEVTVSVMYPPELIAVCQYNGNDNVVSRAEYAPGEVPETLTPEAETEFIMVESFSTLENGERTARRELFTGDDSGFNTFSIGKDGICIPHYCELLWRG